MNPQLQIYPNTRDGATLLPYPETNPMKAQKSPETVLRHAETSAQGRRRATKSTKSSNAGPSKRRRSWSPTPGEEE